MEKKPQTNYRPPIVTLMGHVDHGKTTLLDTIRQTNVAALEQGGITQHIGAYQIIHNSQLITFIDTPGHAAFEKMRSRGAEVADIVVLVVAADDGPKPQTIEAIKHIQKAQRPTIVAITKTDLPHINLEKVKSGLKVAGIIVESLGGQVPVVEVAAPKGKGINELLEVIQLVWQLQPAESQLTAPSEAVVIESRLDKNRGPIATVIVKAGTLSVGQKITVDGQTVTVRALIDDLGKKVPEAQPAKPVEILGLKKVLEVGSIVSEQTLATTPTPKSQATAAGIIAKSLEAKNKFKVVIAADVAGSLEAILQNLPSQVLAVSASVGEISTKDIVFAKTAHAPIITFNLKIPPNIQNQAEREGVLVKSYNVIYELISDLGDVVAGFEETKRKAKITASAKIIAEFSVERKKIAGAKVTAGKLHLGDQVVVKRGQTQVGTAQIISLKRFKKDVSEVLPGQDCGILLDPNLDFAIGDIIESSSI